MLQVTWFRHIYGILNSLWIFGLWNILAYNLIWAEKQSETTRAVIFISRPFAFILSLECFELRVVVLTRLRGLMDFWGARMSCQFQFILSCELHWGPRFCAPTYLRCSLRLSGTVLSGWRSWQKNESLTLGLGDIWGSVVKWLDWTNQRLWIVMTTSLEYVLWGEVVAQIT